jgi:antitoxin YefM
MSAALEPKASSRSSPAVAPIIQETERPPPGTEVYSIWYTFGMSKTVPIRELRSELSHVIDQVADLREHVIVTRHGRPAAVLVPVDEYEALEETAEILSDAETMAAIDEGRREVERGDVVTLDELRRELRARPRT